MLIALIGGRIVPSFTRNGLAARRREPLPAPPGRADALVLALTGATLTLFIATPETAGAVATGALARVANLWWLSRGQGSCTGAEPLVWALHAAFAFVALGLLGRAAAGMGWIGTGVARHLWLVGTSGPMTLAVMTRASHGHTGLPLTAIHPLAALYLAPIFAALARPAQGPGPQLLWLLDLAARGWIAAFGAFVLIDWPVLTLPRRAPQAYQGRQ